MQDWIEKAKSIVDECSFPDYTFKVDVSRTGVFAGHIHGAGYDYRRHGVAIHSPLVLVSRDEPERDRLDCV